MKQAYLKITNPRHRKFALAYVGEAEGSITMAVRAAGYTGKNARVSGSWILRQPLVRAFIEAWFVAFAMTPVELTEMIADMARASIMPFTKHKANGKEIEFNVTAEDWEKYGHWVKSVEVDPMTNRVTKVTVYDAQKAQTTLAKILQLYSDAPLLVFQFQTRRASDTEILQRLEEARRMAQGAAYLGVQKQLTAGTKQEA